MSHQFSPNIEQLIRQKMATGLYASEDERFSATLSRQLDHDEEELRAIQERTGKSLDEGDEGVSVEEAFKRLREKHRILS